MLDYSKEIKEITGQEVKAFIKDWCNKDQEWSKGMSHVQTHGLRCLRMLNGEEQWDGDLALKRKEQNRPMLSENLLPDFVNKPHGEFCMSTPQATVEPVDGSGDLKVAEVIKGLLYSTSYRSSGTAIHKDCFYNLLASSLAAWRVKTCFINGSFNVEGVIEAIPNQFSVRWDLAAKEPDLSDKKWCMILDTMTETEFKKEYGEGAWKPTEWDKPEGSSKDLWWAEKKATVAEVHWIQEDEFILYEHPDGTTSRDEPDKDIGENGERLRTRKDYDRKVYSCVISRTDILSEPTVWPDYTDNPIIPIIITHGRKIVVAGKINYKAIISDGLDIMQLHNYWITAITEALALQPDAPYLATEAQISGFDEWTDLSKKVRAMRYKHDPKSPGPPIRQQPPQISGSMMNMPQYTRQALRDAIGLHQASLGMESNEKSGIAIQKRKQEGDAGKVIFIENMVRGIQLEYKILINIYPTIMDTPRIERIMGADGSKSLAYLNQENPDTKEVLDISVGKYDVRVVMGATFSTQRDEARDMIVQLIQYLGPIAPDAVTAIAPKFLKLINAPDADEMAKIVIATLPPLIQAFYKKEENPDDPMSKLPPEMLAQIQGIQQQLAQSQRIIQQQGQALAELKRDERFKLRELQTNASLEKEKLQIERDRVIKDIRVKELDIQSKKEIALEQIEADIELEITKLMEGFRATKELEKYKNKVAAEKLDAESKKDLVSKDANSIGDQGKLPTPVETQQNEDIQDQPAAEVQQAQGAEPTIA